MMTYPTYQFALNLPWGKIQNLNLGEKKILQGVGRMENGRVGKSRESWSLEKGFWLQKNFDPVELVEKF